MKTGGRRCVPSVLWFAAALVVAPVAGGAGRAEAWGFAAHKKIAELAIGTLPEPLRQFFDRHRVFLIEHAIDPDLWRSVGYEAEPPHHFLDLDAYGASPFAELPHDYQAAVARFGEATIVKNGTVPWRIEEIFGKLRRSFEEREPLQLGRALEDDQLFSAVLAHYLADIHVPFHAVVNYDGQLTGQTGIHSRFEAELYERFGARMRFRPAPAEDLGDAREFAFRTLLDSFKLVEPILEADRAAVGSSAAYDDKYFEALYGKVGSVVEARMTEAAHAVGSVICTAWLRAGKPPLPLGRPAVVRTVKPPTKP